MNSKNIKVQYLKLGAKAAKFTPIWKIMRPNLPHMYRMLLIYVEEKDITYVQFKSRLEEIMNKLWFILV